MLDLTHDGRRYFMLPPVVIGFFEFTFMRTRDEATMAELARLFDQYMHEDDRFKRSVFDGQTQIGRSLVREEALPAGLADHVEVLDWERAGSIVESASMHAVSLCACRHKAGHLGTDCGRELRTCLTLNRSAATLVRSGNAEAITAAEALAVLQREQRGRYGADRRQRPAAGLVHLQLLRLLLRDDERRQDVRAPPRHRDLQLDHDGAKDALHGVRALREGVSGQRHQLG